MKLHDALRKVIRQSGVSIIQEKRLLFFLADYKAFDDYPAVKEVMRAIATGKYGKELCRLAAEESDDDYLRFADSLKETLVRERSFKRELADYAVDSISLAIGVGARVSVTEPDDHGFEAIQRNTVKKVSRVDRGVSNNQIATAGSQAAFPIQVSSGTIGVTSGNSWETASDGAESHRRFYRGKDLTSAFDDGSFRDIFPGDCIIKKITVPGIAGRSTETYTVKFIISDLDLALSRGVTAHHAVIIPEKPVFDSFMNPTDTTAGGYGASYMQRTVMPAFAQGLAAAFGHSHLLSFNADGQSCLCRLMTLSMVFGKRLPSRGFSYSSYQKTDKCMGEEQLAVFSKNRGLRGKDMWYWVSDVKDSLGFAAVVYRVGVVRARRYRVARQRRSPPLRPAQVIFNQPRISAAKRH